MLRVRNISFNYPGQQHFAGIRNLSFDLDRSEVLAILGKSGSGKTTLLKCLYGLEDLTAGTVTVDQQPVLGPSSQLVPGHPDMKLVSQDYYVLDNHTVRENIFDRMTGFHDDEKRKRGNRLMKLLELTPLADSRPRSLSSGQKQRVAIARALAVMPKVLLLDEPFNNLDRLIAERLIGFIVSEVKKKKSALILITHVAEEALKYADRVMVMDKGRMVQEGPTSEVYNNPRNTRLAGLFGAYSLLKKEDLESASRLNNQRARIFVRADRMFRSAEQAGSDIRITVRTCVFNGKCYELIGETATGSVVTVYHDTPVDTGESVWLRYSAAD